MEYREIRITVSEYGKANVVRQWGGMQYENNNTTVCFDIGAIDSSDTSFRIDFDSPEAGYDPGEVIELDGNIISRRIPYKFTRYGGEMQATAVGTRENGSIAYSVPVKIYFTEVDRHEETEDAIALNVSELEMSAIAAAEQAEDAAEDAAESANIASEAAANIGAKQDKFADVRVSTNTDGTMGSVNIDLVGENDAYINAKNYLDIKAGSYLGLISTNAPVSVNGAFFWPTDDGTYIENLYVPPTAEDHCAVNKGYVDNAVKNAGGGASQEQLDAKQNKFAYVSITGNTQYVAMEKPTHFIGNGESGLLIHNLADPAAPLDAVNKRYIDGLVGDIESALDSVIALQNSLIGGDA